MREDIIRNKEQYENAKERYRLLINEILPEWEKKKTETKKRIDMHQYEIFKSQSEDIKGKIEQYEKLTSGEINSLEIDSIYDIRESIIKYRIISGLSQKELADKIIVSEKEIEEWENYNYNKVDLERIIQIIGAIGGKINFKFEKK